jgi:4-amino-4-deoxy-L-arabinose transferase-like glycosyltransferase
MNDKNYKEFLPLALIAILAVLVRLYFFTGHVFSDDAYYSGLSHTLLVGNFADNYLGYPVFPLRIAFIGLTSFSMMIFGANETSTMIFPFLFSILNLLLVYKITRLFSAERKTVITATFFIALFPTDIIFSSIFFPDLINVFFINLGIYFLIRSYVQKKISYTFYGGISLFISMQFKESVYYYLILLIVLFVYVLLKQKKIIPQLIIGIIFIGLNYFIEGILYLFLHNDFFYRITITSINYSYSYYDFFPYTAEKLYGSKNYFRNLFDQIIVINAKSIFLRRFYLFLPIIAGIQSYLSIKKKEHSLLIYWFIGIAVLLIAFTTSFTEYKPLDLSRSWYIYPVVMPMIILSAIFLNRFSKLIRNGFLVAYTLGSLIMCIEYHAFFNTDNLDDLKDYLNENSSHLIYTDHFTKYSVDLMREYNGNSKRILGKDFNLHKIGKGSWILYNKKHIDELKMQDYEFPDFSILKSKSFKMIASFNEFKFFKKSD